VSDKELTVFQAVGKIIEEMEGVSKSQRNIDQGYNFRGIDDVMKALHPLLGKYGVIVVPNVIERVYEEIHSAKGTLGHCAHLHVEWTFYGPTGDSFTASTWGEGSDYSDKATNKAATAALKYVLVPTFAISDLSEDGDASSPEQAPRAQYTPDGPIYATPAPAMRPAPQGGGFAGPGQTYLNTTFDDNPKVKGAGGKFDGKAKKWYVPEGADILKFVDWLPDDYVPVNAGVPSQDVVLEQLQAAFSSADGDDATF
jgi:hypothetical protein